jgi:hypothetical protein
MSIYFLTEFFKYFSRVLHEASSSRLKFGHLAIWIQTDDYNLYALCVVQLGTLATVVGILAILASAEWLNNKVSDLITKYFLFLRRLSKYR